MYLFNADCTNLWSGAQWLPASFPSSLVPAAGTLPTGAQLDNSPARLNSFYRDQKQSAGISTNLSQLTTNQVNRARMRHWLFNNSAGLDAPDLALSFEVLPSQSTDGSSGLSGITWYDYPGKPSPAERGTNVQPSLIARKLPGGSTWYQSFQRNSFGLPTSLTETYGVGSPSTRTYTYTYAANGRDLAYVYRPGSELLEYNTYNSRHQVLTATRYADASHSYTDTWIYNAQGGVYTFTSAAGLTRTVQHQRLLQRLQRLSLRHYRLARLQKRILHLEQRRLHRHPPGRARLNAHLHAGRPGPPHPGQLPGPRRASLEHPPVPATPSPQDTVSTTPLTISISSISRR